MTKNRKRALAVLLAISMVAGFAPIISGGTQAIAKKKATVKKIALNKSQYVLKKGQKVKLKASILPKAAKNTKIIWKSSKPKVAIVNKKGIVKAKAKKGKTVITVKAGNKKAKCTIIIGTPVKKITSSGIKLTVGQKKQLITKIKPTNATIKKLQYKSLNSSVATVNKSGLVTAKKAGTTKIKITATDCGKVIKKVPITVTKASANVNDKKEVSTRDASYTLTATKGDGTPIKCVIEYDSSLVKYELVDNGDMNWVVNGYELPSGIVTHMSAVDETKVGPFCYPIIKTGCNCYENYKKALMDKFLATGDTNPTIVEYKTYKANGFTYYWLEGSFKSEDAIGDPDIVYVQIGEDEYIELYNVLFEESFEDFINRYFYIREVQ